MEFLANHPEILDLKRFVQELPSTPPELAGRGVVVCVASRYLPYFDVLLRSLEKHGCNLPIEAWHRPGELTAHEIEVLAKRGIKCLNTFDANPYATFPKGHEGGYAVKAFALHHTKFREIIFLDADNCLLSDIQYLFDTEPFQDTGAILWDDCADDHSERRHYRSLRTAVGLSPEYAQSETGQMIYDKSRHWRGLAVANRINERGNFFYQFMLGDTNSFQLGMQMVGEHYTAMYRGIPNDRYRCVFHVGLKGEWLLAHRASGRWKWQCGLPWDAEIAGQLLEEILATPSLPA